MSVNEQEPMFNDALYESMAAAIDRVRAAAQEDEAAEQESRFLAKLAFLALSRVNDTQWLLLIQQAAEE